MELCSVLIAARADVGGTEVHVHFGAFSRQHRLDIETDLRRGQPTPLNRHGLGEITANSDRCRSQSKGSHQPPSAP